MKPLAQILFVVTLLAMSYMGLLNAMRETSFTSDKENIGNLADSHLINVLRPVSGCSDPIELHHMYYTARRDKASFETIRDRAEHNDPCAQYYLAELSPPSEREKWLSMTLAQFRNAAEKGNSDAQYNLASPLLTRDMAQREKWLAASTKQGNPYAQYELALQYYDLAAVYLPEIGEEPKERLRALPLLLSAAERGHVQAMDILGYLHESRSELDKGVAAEWYLKAAERGYIGGQKHLSQMYLHGKGVKQDWNKAYFWGCLAVRCFDATEKPKGYFLDLPKLNVKDHLTDREIAEIEEIASEWEPVVPPSP